MKCRVAYHCGQPPSRMTRMMRGILRIEDSFIEVTGPTLVKLDVSEIDNLSFRHELFLFYIILQSHPPLYLTPELFGLRGFVQITLESRNTKVYTALHNMLRGPGRCAKCGYDLRASALPCPECGFELVRPIV